MAGSSRWIARPVGRWLENPNSRSTRHTWVVPYARPNSVFSSTPTRAKVHNSVGKPHATAPATSRLDSRLRSPADSPPGRPKGLRRHACPSAARARSQFDAVCRLTASVRATSACDTPRASIRMPLRRRFSSAFTSRLCLTVVIYSRLDRDPITTNARPGHSVVNHLRKAQ